MNQHTRIKGIKYTKVQENMIILDIIFVTDYFNRAYINIRYKN